MPHRKFVYFINTVVFIAVAVILALVVRFHREENVPVKSLTAYAKTQQPAALEAPSPVKPASRETTAQTPKDPVVKLVRAWNHGSSEEIAELFTADGVLTTPNGSRIHSKSEIEKTIREKRSGLLGETTLNNAVEEVSQNGNTAVVKGRYELTGIKILGFETAATGTFVLRQLKQDGRWLISSAEVKTGDKG